MILLRTHSRFSFHRATASLEQLVGAASADGMSHLALTDYYGLFGAVQFAQLCKSSEVRPIIGMMASVQGAESGRSVDLTLLAKNSLGYRSLCELSTIYQTEKETQSGGITWERFKQSCQGLVCIVCADGGVQDEPDMHSLASLFGEDGYFGVGEDSNAAWLALGETCGLAPVWCEPVFHVDPADRDLFRLLQAIDRNVRLEEISQSELPHIDKWVGWPRGRGDRYSDTDFLKLAVANTEMVAEKCGDCLPDGRPLWPVLSLPEGESAAGLLRKKCQNQLQALYEEVSSEIEARLSAELDLITHHHFEPLFLILGEVIEFVQANNILMGSRGSVANSLVAYCLGISLVDPMKYDLLFERFLNPERKSLPDIDLDFESRNGRDAVLEFIRKRYGEHRVALVSTVNSYRTKSAVRETAKAYGMTSAEISRLSKQLPGSWRHPDPERRAKSTAEAIVEMAANDHEREILQMAMRIRGFPSHMGLHPGGIVVSPPEKMTDHCPLFLSPKGFLATQFDFRDVETLGLIKMDVLGIRALTVIEIALEIINEKDAVGGEGGWRNHTKLKQSRFSPLRPLHVADIPLDDEATGDLIERGDTLGVFQCESTGSQRTLRQLKARDPWGLALANAFFKPGPATGGQAKNFIRRIRGEEKVSYLHPVLEPILSKTAGVLVFQEDVLRICTEVGGLNWTEANSIRKGMSKFEGSRIRELRERFVTGAVAKIGMNEAIAQTLWDQIEAFAGYGFNAGHALSYALPSFQMAWLKTHFPAEFMTARLRAGGGYSHPSVNVAEARRLGFQVHGPHVNFSEAKWRLVGGSAFGRPVAQYVSDSTDTDLPNTEYRPTIYCGLGWVKDLRRSTIQAIIAERKNGLFQDFDDFVRRVPLREKELKHLVRCGALDGLGPNRRAMGEMKMSDNQMSLFGVKSISPEVPIDTAEDRFAWEIEILGMPFSVQPTDFLHEKEEMPLAQLHQTNGRVKTVGWRLPSYTGGKGFYLSDGEGLVLAWDKSKRPVRSWEPMVLVGEWKRDRFGGEWLQVEKIETISN